MSHIDDEAWISETVRQVDEGCIGEASDERHIERILRERLPLLRDKPDSEDIAGVIRKWWLEKPRSRDPGGAEYRVVYTEQVYDLMRRLS